MNADPAAGQSPPVPAACWQVLAGHVRDYQRRHGDTYPRAGLQLADGYPIGRRVADLRRDHAAGKITAEVAALFDVIPGWDWTPPAKVTRRSFDEWLQLCSDYLVRTKTDRIRPFVVTQADGAKLGAWVQAQASKYSRLSDEQRQALDQTLGPKWRTW